MGDRTFLCFPCPRCKDREFHIYDAPSSLMWVGLCDKCGYKDPHKYVETKQGVKLVDTSKERSI